MTELNQQPGQKDVRSLTEKMQDAIVRAGNSLADLPQDGADLPIDRRSRLLAWTILLLFFLMLQTLAVVLLFERSSSSRRLFYVAIPVIYAVLLASGFVLNRKRCGRLAALVTVWGGLAAIWASILLDSQFLEQLDIIPLFYISLSILLASFLLTSLETCVIALAQIAGLVWLLERQDAWSSLNWQSLLTFMAFITLLSLGISHIIRADLHQIDQQNKKLLANETALRDLATRDSLTGLYNRHYLDDTLPREVSRVVRRNSTLGIIMIEVDFFKQINDQYGHAAGDEFLKLVGHVLAGKIRDSDIACRYGGDEYVLIMPDASLKATFERAESIRRDAESWSFKIDGKTIASPAISCGVAIFPDHGSTGDAVLQAADAALYAAKTGGRNQTRMPGDETISSGYNA